MLHLQVGVVDQLVVRRNGHRLCRLPINFRLEADLVHLSVAQWLDGEEEIVLETDRLSLRLHDSTCTCRADVVLRLTSAAVDVIEIFIDRSAAVGTCGLYSRTCQCAEGRGIQRYYLVGNGWAANGVAQECLFLLLILLRMQSKAHNAVPPSLKT